MRFTVLKQGETLGDLVARLSRTVAAPEAIAALESANPRLSLGRTESARADLLVVVPRNLEAADPDGAREGETPMTSALDLLLSRVGQALESVTAALEREERRADEAVTRLESTEFQELAETQPVLEQRSPDLKAAARARLERATAARDAETTISDRVLEDLSSLRSAVLDRSEVARALSGLSVSAEPRGGRTPGGRLTRAGAEAGERAPARKAATKKSTTKKVATTKSTTRKAVTEKSTVKKAATKKSTTKKAATKKGTSKKAATKMGATKKAATKKSAAKKTTGGGGARPQ